MSYCTTTDLITFFGRRELVELTDHDGIGDIDNAVVAKMIALADAEIDAQLRARYEVPVTPVPAILTAKACDIARYHLYDYRVTEPVAQRYKDALAWLREVRDGKIDLGVATPTPTASGGRVVQQSGISNHDWNAY